MESADSLGDEKLVLVGAGSAMFTRGLVADLISRGVTGHLALVDTNHEALSVAERLTVRMLKTAGSDLRVTATTDRRDVLRDATIVIATIGVGGRRSWEQDVFIPRRYGIYAPVGDTVGPGGSSRAMRTIPPMVAIAEDVVELAQPGALFLNYTNPMSPVCRAIRKETGANVVGLCHGALGSVTRLARHLGIPTSNITYRIAGYNHLTWITQLRDGGRDLMPDLHRLADQMKDPQLPDDALETEPQPDPPDEDFNPISWRMLQMFGAFPAPGDRHVTEFFPALFRDGHYFGMVLGLHRGSFSFESTIQWGDHIYSRMAAEVASTRPLDESYLETTPGGSQTALQILEDVRLGRGGAYTANLENRGAIPNLPPEVVVEGNAVTRSDGIQLASQEPLPPALAGHLAARFHWAEVIVEAALEGSRDKFIEALVLDGYVNSLDQAESLGDELLAAHAVHLPWLKSHSTSSAGALS